MQLYNCVLISLLTYHFIVNLYDPFPNMTLTELVCARCVPWRAGGEILKKKSQGRKTWTEHCNYYMKKNICSESHLDL